MSESISVTCLGTGTSHGVPMIGCHCAVCTSDDPRDRRMRVSIVVRHGTRTILVDTPPELRLQCIANGINRVDAVLFTHHHADHVTGLDDLRRFNYLMKGPIPCYGMPETIDVLQTMFAYAFVDEPEYPSQKPQLDLHPVTGDGPIPLIGLQVLPIPLWHGPTRVLGFRFGRFAYCTDCNEIPDQSMAMLEDLDVLILDGLRFTPHPTHFHLDAAIEVAARIGARQTYFTHIAHEMGHAATNQKLPAGMALAHDSLTFDVRP